jgi:hypothetical protein
MIFTMIKNIHNQNKCQSLHYIKLCINYCTSLFHFESISISLKMKNIYIEDKLEILSILYSLKFKFNPNYFTCFHNMLLILYVNTLKPCTLIYIFSKNKTMVAICWLLLMWLHSSEIIPHANCVIQNLKTKIVVKHL